MKHAIITCSDAKCGDFLVNHWLSSLKETNDLRNIDVIVIDYGLSKSQVAKLKKQKVLVYKFKRDGFPACIRFRDMNKILSRRKYDQVMTIDGGDVIFQTDISELFNENKNQFRAAYETAYIDFKILFMKDSFSKKNIEKISKALKAKPMINAGVIIAPYEKFKKLCTEVCDLLIDQKKFGPDQIAVNYILYRDGFKNLDEKYNFVIGNAKGIFHINKGEFYLKTGEKIPIVHNAGGSSVFRRIENFGYGEKNNKVRKIRFFICNKIFKIASALRKKDNQK